MAKTRQTPRYEPDVTRVDTRVWPEMTADEFFEVFDDFMEWTTSRKRSKVSWFQSLREYANLRFHEAYEEATK